MYGYLKKKKRQCGQASFPPCITHTAFQSHRGVLASMLCLLLHTRTRSVNNLHFKATQQNSLLTNKLRLSLITTVCSEALV